MINLADVHLREETEETVLKQVLPEAANAAVQEGSCELSILGDLLTFRYKIDARIQNNLMDVLQHIVDQGVTVRILPGNHDQYEVGGRNALEPLGRIMSDRGSRVLVYTNPTCDQRGYWLPYRKNPEDLLGGLQVLTSEQYHYPPEQQSPNILYMHHGIHGASMNDSFVDEHGFAPATFSNFKIVLLGHYHRRQQIGHCHYIGSPYQTKADESGQEKGYAVFDGERLQYVTTDWGKKFHRFTLDVGQNLDLSHVRPGDEVRVQTSSQVDPTTVIDQLQKSGVTDHVVTPDVEVLESRLDVPENSPIAVYAQAYVDAQETPLDKTRLMSTFQELAHE